MPGAELSRNADTGGCLRTRRRSPMDQVGAPAQIGACRGRQRLCVLQKCPYIPAVEGLYGQELIREFLRLRVARDNIYTAIVESRVVQREPYRQLFDISGTVHVRAPPS